MVKSALGALGLSLKYVYLEGEKYWKLPTEQDKEGQHFFEFLVLPLSPRGGDEVEYKKNPLEKIGSVLDYEQ